MILDMYMRSKYREIYSYSTIKLPESAILIWSNKGNSAWWEVYIDMDIVYKVFVQATNNYGYVREAYK